MRFLLLIPVLFLCHNSMAQELTIQPDSVYGEGYADKIVIRTSTIEIINPSDSTYTVIIKQIESNRDNLNWNRSLYTHQITYMPGVDSISFELNSRDTGSLTFEFYPELNVGCVDEKYEILQVGPSEYRDTVRVRACALETVSVGDMVVRTLVYPNPVVNELIIEVQPSLAEKEYFILSESGQLIQKGILTQKINRINTCEMVNGRYFILISGVDRPIRYTIVNH